MRVDLCRSKVLHVCLTVLRVMCKLICCAGKRDGCGFHPFSAVRSAVLWRSSKA